MFANTLSRYWGMTLLRGLIWMLFGIVTFMLPGPTLKVFTLLFGVFALADGFANIATAIGGRKVNEDWWMLLLLGLAGVGVAALTFTHPDVTALVVLFWIAAWAIITGLLEVAVGIWLRKEIQGEFWLILAGLASIAFGAFLFARPAAGLISVIWVIAGYAFIFGLMLAIFAFRARSFTHRLERMRAA